MFRLPISSCCFLQKRNLKSQEIRSACVFCEAFVSTKSTLEKNSKADASKGFHISSPRGQMRPFTREDVAIIRSKLTTKAKTRDLALFETAISTLLRASDLVALKVADVTGRNGDIAEVATIKQKKTDALNVVPLTQAARAALAVHIAEHGLAPDAYLFTNASNSGIGRPLSTTAFRTLAKLWADLAGYTDTQRFSGHSLRRTRAAIIYSATRDIVACARLLGHSSTAHTQAYLGVGRDEALALSRQFEI